MASKHAQDLRRRIDVASENLSRQRQGMDAHMERADAPGEWTTREVLSHLLFEPGVDLAATLATFSERDYPVVEIDPGATFLDEPRLGELEGVQGLHAPGKPTTEARLRSTARRCCCRSRPASASCRFSAHRTSPLQLVAGAGFEPATFGLQALRI